MIELAPQNKIGLPLSNPIMIASGFCGYGDAYQKLFDMSFFGAVVTQPITLRPQRGATQPRLSETKAGFILNTGKQNPGVKKVISQYGKKWPRLGVPVIAHLPADEPNDLMRSARALSGVKSAQGHSVLVAVELGLPYRTTPQAVKDWLKAIQDGTELPILVKLPLGVSRNVAEVAVTSNADALVIGTPLLGTAMSFAHDKFVTGPLYGPTLHGLALHDLQNYAKLGIPLVAAGGVHSLADAQAFLDAGALAVQLDSLLFIDPKLAHEIAQDFS